MEKQQQRNPAKEPKTTKVANELTNEELSKVSGGAFNASAKDESTDKDHRDWMMNIEARDAYFAGRWLRISCHIWSASCRHRPPPRWTSPSLTVIRDGYLRIACLRRTVPDVAPELSEIEAELNSANWPNLPEAA